MTNLVELQEEMAITTSLKLAEVFEKQHKDVLRAIKNLECPENFRERNFAPSSYTTLQNKVAPMYQITRQGFTLLAMGFTGKKATQFKIAYIEAFDQMEEYIREMQKTSLSKNEYALIFQLVNFFKYLENCRMIEKTHRDTFMAQNQVIGKPYQELLKEFYVMRNNLLGIGGFKAIKEKYTQHYINNPNFRYNPKNKFSMIFTMDEYEPLRHAIADFLKLELQPDGYTLKMASEAKEMASRSKTNIEKENETNLFQVKEDELIEFGSLKTLAKELLKLS